MPITLKPEPEAWLKARVESGDFASIEEAARELIDERIADLEFESDDLSWAKPLVDEGIAALERGERRVHLARRAQGPQRGSARRSTRMTARVIVTDFLDAIAPRTPPHPAIPVSNVRVARATSTSRISASPTRNASMPDLARRRQSS